MRVKPKIGGCRRLRNKFQALLTDAESGKETVEHGLVIRTGGAVGRAEAGDFGKGLEGITDVAGGKFRGATGVELGNGRSEGELRASQGLDMASGGENDFVVRDLIILVEELGKCGAKKVEVIAGFKRNANVSAFRQKVLSVFRFRQVCLIFDNQSSIRIYGFKNYFWK